MSDTSDNIKIACPHCKVVLETESSIEGTRVECPKCGKEFVAQQHQSETTNSAKTPSGLEWMYDKLRAKKKIIIGIVLLVVALLFMFSMCSGEQTVEQYRSKLIREINSELADSSFPLRKRIESAHLTVTVKNAYVVRCDITTIDGSDRAGADEDNIRTWSMLIRFEWEGIIDSGYTDLRINYDAENKRLDSLYIEKTTALINTEDPDFWIDLGMLIGSML